MGQELTVTQWQELWQLTEDHKEMKEVVSDLAGKVDKIYGAIIGNELGQEGFVDQMKHIRNEVHQVKTRVYDMEIQVNKRVDQIERQLEQQKAWKSGAMWVVAAVASMLGSAITLIFKFYSTNH